MASIANSSTALKSYNLCTTLKKDSINYILYTQSLSDTLIKTLYYNDSNTVVSGGDINIASTNMVNSVDCGIINTIVYGNDNI